MRRVFAGSWRTLHALTRQPGYFLLAAATLALGVGTFFATFALVDALLMAPPGFTHHGSVVLYGEVVRPSSPRSLSATLYDTVGLPRGVLSRGLARSVERASVRSGAHASLLVMQRMDDGFLPTLGVVPAAGALTLKPGGGDGVMLSWRLWQAWFAGDPHVAGRVITVDGRPLRIAGVLPAAYRLFDDVDVILPLHGVPGASASVPNFLAVARLAPDASSDDLVGRLRATAAASDGAARAAMFGITPIDDALTAAAAPTVWFFLGCAGLVVATACGNLANLMMARALGRSRETALRRALGAGFWRSWAPAAAEAGFIAVAGVLAGTVLGHALVTAGEAYIPDAWRVNAGPIDIRWRVYLASAVVALFMTVVAAIGGGLREPGRGGQERQGAAARARVAWVQVQLGLATLLLSLCVVRGMQTWRQQDVAPGFDLDGAAAARFRPDPLHFTSAKPVAQAMAAIEARLAGERGALRAGVTTQLPVGTNFNVTFAAPGGVPFDTQYAVQTPGARAALGMHLVAGRDLATSDAAGGPAVVVVNQAFLARIPGATLGSTVLKVSRSMGTRSLRIVGIVANTRDAGPALPPRPWAIVPFAQLPPAEFASFRSLLSYYLVVHASSYVALAGIDPGEALRDVAPWLAIEPPRPLGRAWNDVRAASQRDTWLASLFAGVGLGLGLVGLYSAQRIHVASRRRELALCAAVGGTPLDLLGLCLAHGVARATVGVILGLSAALAFNLWPPAALAQGARVDLDAVCIVATVMLLLTSAVSLPPALRSAAIPPSLVLREQ
ncbi:FtsX-like permease family protein [Luteibacter pinisoli]|uniref:FtsX-like permease family protein n=1 Tax=Luteibacter pinisoli TaxID=2589080 RepID=A0A4Y5YXY7_9GAMM|nr:ABC transporter permease [Luteibacter pinisoli]QDE37852.1 FtsX-like permease family protein [Luteibacter pinisoli]